MHSDLIPILQNQTNQGSFPDVFYISSFLKPFFLQFPATGYFSTLPVVPTLPSSTLASRLTGSIPLLSVVINWHHFLFLSGLRGVGAGDGSDFTVAIIEGDKNVLLCSFKSTSEQCQVSYDWEVQSSLLSSEHCFNSANFRLIDLK